MTYSIRFCEKHESNKLHRFLKESWKENHIFVTDHYLLDWQYLQEDRYNFVVANHNESNSFHGVLGLISPRFYSEGKIESGDDIWLAIWKVDKNLSESKSIGTDLLEFVKTQLSPTSISGIGTNARVAPLYKLMGFKIGSLRQFYILNPGVAQFSLAHVSNNTGNHIPSSVDEVLEAEIHRIREIDNADLIKHSSICSLKSPHKDVQYLLGRYTNHPRYQYRFFVIERGGAPISLFVARKVFVNKASCLRIVEFFGIELLKSNLCQQFQRILTSEGSEYFDLMVSGVDEAVIKRLGFIECSNESYVPHLFEPFVSEFVKVRFAVKSPNNFVIFKGDSDLDRPNLFSSGFFGH